MSDVPGTVERLRRMAGAHRVAGRPLAAEHAYRIALSIANGRHADQAVSGIIDDYTALLVELGRDAEAAHLAAGARPAAGRPRSVG